MSSTTPFINLQTEIVQAGAGAGKTTYLVQKVCDVYQEFKTTQRTPRLVVTTFSRKATQEVKERLLIKALELKDDGLLKFVSSSNSVFITTIHGVLLQFLKGSGWQLGLIADLEMLSTSELQRRDTQILRELIKAHQCQEILFEWRLSELVGAANEFYNKFVSKEWKHFLDEQTLTRNLLELTLNARNMAGALRQNIYEAADEKWLKLLPVLTDLDDVLVKLTSDLDRPEDFLKGFLEYHQIISDMRQSFTKPRRAGGGKEKNPALHEDAEQFLEAIDTLIQNDPEFIQSNLKFFKILESLFIDYSQKRLQKILETGGVSFNDLELLSVKLVAESTSSAEDFAKDWDFWLLDEFQDTSPLQVRLLRQLIGGRPYFVVGDPQQSIYLFRGARSEVFAEEQKKISSQNGILNSLQRNYRSTPAVLSYINEFFSRFDNRFLKMNPRLEKENRSARSQRTTSADVRVVWTADTTQELQAVGNHVQSLLENGAKSGGIAILARRRRHIQLIAKALQKLRIPYFAHLSSGFSSRREVQDIIALLRFAFVPQDNKNVVALCRSPWFFIEDWKLAGLRSVKGDSIWRKLQLQMATHTSVVRLAQFQNECQGVGIYIALIATLKRTGFFEASLKIDPTGRREANIWKMLEQIYEYLKNPNRSLLQLETELVAGSGASEDGSADAVSAIEPDRVNVMTIHGSKGLQFDHVLIPFMGEMPKFSYMDLFYCDEETGVSSLKVRNAEEERKHFYSLQKQFERFKKREELESERLLYVAMTRAKESLYLSSKDPYANRSWAQFLERDIGFFERSDYKLSVEVFKDEETSSTHLANSTKPNADGDVSDSAMNFIAPWS